MELDVEIVYISTDTSLTANAVRPFFETNGYPWTVLRDSRQALKAALRIETPTKPILVDKEGRVIFFRSTYLEEYSTIEDILNAVENYYLSKQFMD